VLDMASPTSVQKVAPGSLVWMESLLSEYTDLGYNYHSIQAFLYIKISE
jgi:hypothetical protein